MSNAVQASLAKSPHKGRNYSTAEHGEGAAHAVRLLGSTGTLAEVVALFKAPTEDTARVARLAEGAALVHDTGKETTIFQQIVRGGRPSGAMPLRHELVSCLLIEHLRPVLEPCLGQLDFGLLLAGVCSHHLKVQSGDLDLRRRRSAAEDTYRFSHPDVRLLVERLFALFAVGRPVPELPDMDTFSGAAVQQCLGRLAKCDATLRRHTKSSPHAQALRACVVTLVVLADTIDSARFSRDEEASTWVPRLLRAPDAATQVRRMSLGQAKGGTLTDLQERAGSAGSLHNRVLVLGGCGSGKTLAALKCAEAQMSRCARSRLVSLAPTKGLTIEQYQKTVRAVRDPWGITQVHSGASYEFHSMRSNPDEDSALRSASKWEPDQRLPALNLWGYSVIHATYDQFLSLVSPQRKGLCAAPVLAQAALIVDEIHTMDLRTWGLFLLLVKHTNIPITAMTATISPKRRLQLEDAGFHVVADPEAAEEMRPRYKVHTIPAPQAREKALDAYRAGKRVLWIVNTVSSCQSTVAALRAEGVPAIIYHARYLPPDRQRHHKAALTALGFGSAAPALLISTQTCELGLDLDADVLVTEVCPPSGLVQRMGRAGRDSKRPRIADVFVYENKNKNGRTRTLPYEEAEVMLGVTMVGDLCGRVLSQRDLASALDDAAFSETYYTEQDMLFRGGICTLAGHVRDIDFASSRALLPEHVDVAVSRYDSFTPLDDLLLQIAVGEETPRAHESLPEDIRLAEGTYDPDLGYVA